ncbi:MAG: 16S rRNA (adenine(1518)-N(6)/adenine(1519)-N(6))-dimethyltransferase RsmA [Spirochaetaceae bacterium]|nr:16S rRNA (adenine(1518)-N(6)/adenine(1519)-N(6))-dimethyltransferase RsmA [Spirochaetaceae bacterium]
MSKRFGQNFLVNRTQRERIIAELRAKAGASVWEIGPGIGAMTALALEAGLVVTAFEIDHGFSRLLRHLFGSYPSFRLVEGDFLKTWKKTLEESGAPERIFGNLPYSAANAIVADLIEGGLVSTRMVFTVQKEAALRMAASPGSKDYSAFSVLCTSACKVRLAFDLGASSFWPAPRVTSSLAVLEPRREPVAADDRLGFSRFVRSVFLSRRKTLRNNAMAAGRNGAQVAEALAARGIRPDVRAEALRPEELAALYVELERRRSAGTEPSIATAPPPGL